MLPDALVRKLKAEAQRRGLTMSEVVEAALRRYLAEATVGHLPPLPPFSAGRPRVDVVDRDALDEAMR